MIHKRQANRIAPVIVSVFLAILLALSMPGFSYGQTCSYRIMPLGDSITRGIGSSDLSGYRKVLFNTLYLNTDHEFDFVGSKKDGPTSFDNDHEGHGGYTSFQIASNAFSWLADNPAEIVLLHAGTNDLTPSTQDVESILDEINLFSRDTWVVLALIINQNPYSATVSTFNDNLLAMAQNRIANGYKIIVVDQEAALLYPGDLADQLHPNDAGYSKMAQVWRDALEPFLNQLCSGPPHIITSVVAPSKRGFVNLTYFNQVKAYGDPSNSFDLLDSPTGMTIGSASGIINWVPFQTGSFNVTVRVRNTLGSDSQSFVIVVTDPASEFVLDDGGSGTTAVGSWRVSIGPNPYGGQSLFSDTISGTYTFQASRSGLEEVYLWWTQYANRNTSVPVRIYDGATLLATVNVDQTKNGGQWNLLGSYSFSGSARVQIVSTSDTVTTSADAVKFVPR
jgi:lysophospholipase L1-like esterase